MSAAQAINPQASLIKTVVFDLGGVLIDWNPRYLFRQLFDTETEVEHFLASVCTPQWNHEQDRGRSWATAVKELTERFPEHAASIAAFRDRWEETLGDELPETVQLLEVLRNKGNVRLIALTNWSQETFPVARARFPFLQWFEGIVVSGEERQAKPDAALFEVMNDRYTLSPSECLFIDDSYPNIRTAAALGYHVVHFKGAPDLEQRLSGYGLVGEGRNDH